MSNEHSARPAMTVVVPEDRFDVRDELASALAGEPATVVVDRRHRTRAPHDPSPIDVTPLEGGPASP